MKVLALDPGYDRLGVAILEHGQNGKETLIHSLCIETDKKADFADRLFQVGDAVKNQPILS